MVQRADRRAIREGAYGNDVTYGSRHEHKSKTRQTRLRRCNVCLCLTSSTVTYLLISVTTRPAVSRRTVISHHGNWTARLWIMKLPRPDPVLHVTSGSPAHETRSVKSGAARDSRGQKTYCAASMLSIRHRLAPSGSSRPSCDLPRAQRW